MTSVGEIQAGWDDLEGVHPPQVTRKLHGHVDSLEALAQRYRSGNLHHAWLVHGPRGIGKATFAWRLAEHLMRFPDFAGAPARPVFDDDAIHSQIAHSGHPNVLSIRRPYDTRAKKFKTQITADETRGELIRFLGQSSGAAAWRVIILDAAEDMNVQSANALLKFLEEPPPDTLFLILAHSARSMLATIRSRCQVLALKPLVEEEMRHVLAAQPLMEGVSAVETDALIARAKGSPRRALLLHQSGVLEGFNQFVANVAAKTADFSQVHKLAGRLSPAAKSGEYTLFMDLIYDHLSDSARNGAAGGARPAKLNRLAGIWQRVREHSARNEALNLDRKQVILDLFADMRTA